MCVRCQKVSCILLHHVICIFIYPIMFIYPITPHIQAQARALHRAYHCTYILTPQHTSMKSYILTHQHTCMPGIKLGLGTVHGTAHSRKDETRNGHQNTNRNPECSSQVSFRAAHLKRNMTFDYSGFRIQSR